MGIRNCKNKEPIITIAVIGVDGVGKSTILNNICSDECFSYYLALHFFIEITKCQEFLFIAWDVGHYGQIQKPLSAAPRKEKLREAQAVIIVVDSSDRSVKIKETELELKKLLREDEKEIKGKPFLILANKQDLPSAMTDDEISEILSLPQLLKDREWGIIPMVAINNEGFKETIEWLRKVMPKCNTKKITTADYLPINTPIKIY